MTAVPDEFLARLYDAVIGGHVLHEGCAPLPPFAGLDAGERAEAAEWLLPIAHATLRLFASTPVADPLLDASSVHWVAQRVDAFLAEQMPRRPGPAEGGK